MEICKKNLVRLSPEEFQLTLLDEFIKKDEDDNPFKIGESYRLKLNSRCALESERIVTIVHILDNIDSIVVKEENNDKSTIFSLSAYDCEFLGIEYQDGLQLFSQQLSWERVNEEKKKEIDLNDLSTYPILKDDNSLRYVLISIPSLKIHISNRSSQSYYIYKGICFSSIYFLVNYKENVYVAKSKIVRREEDISVFEISFVNFQSKIIGLDQNDIVGTKISDVLSVFLKL